MNNYLEFTNEELSLPFTVDELFTDEDYDEIYGNNYTNTTISENTIQTENIIWIRNVKRHVNENGDEIVKVAKGSTGILRNRPNKLSRIFWEWVNDTYHEDWIGDLFKGGSFPNIAPVSILVWNNNSPWHMEPGETDPIRLKHIRENRSNLSKWWGPWWRVSTSVCNFRLIGDEENSSIEFAEMSDEFSQTIIDTREKFFKKWMEAKEGFYTFARDNEESPTIQSYGPVDQILDTKPWHNHMNVQETKKGFKSPFMLDFGSLHRVLVGDQSTRVTFRLHSGMKLDWNTMKDYRQQGILLKC